MRDTPVARKSGKAPQDHALLTAACTIVAREGLAGLSLRPLAEMLGVSVTVLSTHHGARIDVIAAICRAACERDALLFAQWRGMLAALVVLSPSMAADLAEAILEDQVTQHRALSTLYLEMLHACTWDATLPPAFAEWSALRRDFWQEFGQRANLAPGMLDCGWWHGYIVAELAYGMALNGVTPYRMLRRLCLRRLFAGGTAAQPQDASREGGSDAALFALLLEQMRVDGEVVTQAGTAVVTAAETRSESASGRGRAPAWLERAARSCGIRLAAQGVAGLTHRAIAADIAIPHTTLSYRFPTQYHLVIAGLEAIVAHIRAAVDADSLSELQRKRMDGDGQKLDLARATFAVAIAAARMPELAPYTAYMRSRRGNNLAKVLQKYIPDAQGIDALCAQLVSMGLTGLTNTEPPGAASEASVAAAFAASARWLTQSAQSAPPA